MTPNPYVELAHFLHQIIQLEDSDFRRILRAFEVNDGKLAKDLTGFLDRLPRGSGVVAARIDLRHLQRLRQSLPALRHRRLGRIPDEADSPAVKAQGPRLEVT